MSRYLLAPVRRNGIQFLYSHLMKAVKILLTGALAIASQQLSAQKAAWRDTTSRIVIPELKYKLNPSGSHYLKATLVSQIWARYSEMNPGSRIYDTPVNAYADLGIRRLRIQAFGQLTDRIFFYTQFGMNNFNFLAKRNVGSYFHDVVTEYRIIPQLSIGGGLTGWSGLSRFASPGVGSIMGIDAPLYQQATNGTTDQFLRKLSVYAKGQIGRLDYRVALTSPQAYQNTVASAAPLAIGKDAQFSLAAPKMQEQAYVFWQFFDKEANSLPYTTGTYLGKKKVFNIGAGSIHQPDAMWFLGDNNDTISADMLLLGADAYLDMPVNRNGSAISAYVAFSDFRMGHNYLRNNSAMNPANGVGSNASFNGAGIGFPMIGTGQTLYGQFGYKFKDNLLGDNGTLMPYVTAQYSQFQKLIDPMLLFSGGINWFIHGTHQGKLTLDYQSRPVFNAAPAGELLQTSRKGVIALQYQISL